MRWQRTPDAPHLLLGNQLRRSHYLLALIERVLSLINRALCGHAVATKSQSPALREVERQRPRAPKYIKECVSPNANAKPALVEWSIILTKTQ